MFHASNYETMQIMVTNKNKIEAIASIEKIIENVIEVVHENLPLMLMNNRLSLILQTNRLSLI